MKFATFVLFAVTTGAAVWSVPVQKRGVDPSLVNPFNVQAGIPFGDGSADCKGFNDARIPCQCPPNFDDFVNAVSDAVSHGFVPENPTVLTPSFPTDDSKDSQNTRLHVCSVVLQNLSGAGKGCPIVSTNYSQQQQAINALPDTPAPAASPATSPAASPAEITPASTTAAPPAETTPASTTAAPPAATTLADVAACPPPTTVTVSAAAAASSSPAEAAASSAPPAVLSAATSTAAAPPATATSASDLTDDQIIALAPDLGFTAGENPDGTGNCDGAVDGANGKPIQVPCACPPSPDVYHAALIADVRAGFAIHNPTVKVTFPITNSTNDQHGRITAASIAIQNLNGPGQGCPIVSTTLQAQDKAIGN